MKYNVIERGDDISKGLTERFHKLAAQQGMPRDEENPDIVLSIGGDGTMLQAFHKYVEQLRSHRFRWDPYRSSWASSRIGNQMSWII